ncbi:glutathione S-transferase T3-like [Quercus lobata]|uniref:No apical meristem-associated C-terminal domain-containing protein n=1 Tax=Quercus lobata TaxID=97700 RepID=A0A7N2KSR1_QUELO|nr:glutathione S-transferase T3-like [Quercus lobata]
MDSSIPRDTSFTNLLEDSYDEYMLGSSRISEDSVPQAQAFSQMSPPQVESTAKKLQRGSNFTIQEDVLLVSAFLNVNQDAVQSTNQKCTTYWSRIWEYYHQWKTFTSERTVSSLTNRWSTIQLCTNKFCGCLAQIESKNESGKTNEDKLNAAKELYQVLQHTKFQYEHCWNLLKHSPKWLAIGNSQQPKKRGRSEPSSRSNLESISLEDDDIPQVPIVSLERPLGVKAQKERLKKQKSREGTTSHIEDILNVMMEERRKMSEMKMACIEKGRLVDQEHDMARIQLKDKKLEIARMKEENEMEKLRMEKLKEEKELMMMDVSMLSPLQQEYIRQCQMEILEKRRSCS